MIYTTSLFNIFILGKKFNLPPDITQLICNFVINNSANIIIDKWYSYINIHNINLCYIVNKLPILQGHDYFGNTISYYDLHDIHLKHTLKICSKYIRRNISYRDWWIKFVTRVSNGYYFVHNHNDPNVKISIFILKYIFGYLTKK
jgi:hypothetical protein